MKNLLFLIFFINLLGCAAPTSRESMELVKEKARNKPASESMDSFWVDYTSPPDREVKHWEFYYKHCSLIGRKPYPDRGEYSCTTPY